MNGNYVSGEIPTVICNGVHDGVEFLYYMLVLLVSTGVHDRCVPFVVANRKKEH